MLPHRSAGTSRLPAAARELAVPARRSVPDVPARDRVPDAPTCDRGPDGPTRDHVPDVSARDRGPEARARSRLLDGLRGLAIVLVAVSHGWAIWPANATSDLGVFTGILRAGNIAVTVSFVVGGYLLMRSLLGELARTGRIGAWRAIWRRTARLSANVYLLLVAIAVLFVIDLSDPFTREATRDTVLHVGTYSWNWYLMDHALSARSDLGHLWFVCVYLQVTIGLVVLARYLAHRALALVAVLAGLFLLVVWWRGHVVLTEGWYAASLRTTTRMDGMVGGALLAAIMNRWPRGGTHARFALYAGLAGLLVLIAVTGNSDLYYQSLGLAAVFSIAAIIWAEAHLPAGATLGARALSWAPLATLGRYSMGIFVWHYPVFWAVARHTGGWAWPLRTVLALAITGVLVVLVHRLVDEPVQRRLARSRAPEPTGRRRRTNRDGA